MEWMTGGTRMTSWTPVEESFPSDLHHRRSARWVISMKLGRAWLAWRPPENGPKRRQNPWKLEGNEWNIHGNQGKIAF